jgi:hypothetical protein
MSSGIISASTNGLASLFPTCTSIENAAASIPTLLQPFVVGPGHSPIPAKIVTQIVLGKSIDLNDLLAANLAPLKDLEPQLMLDGCLVLKSQPKKKQSATSMIS